jgi:hypothetical protein
VPAATTARSGLARRSNVLDDAVEAELDVVTLGISHALELGVDELLDP